MNKFMRYFALAAHDDIYGWPAGGDETCSSSQLEEVSPAHHEILTHQLSLHFLQTPPRTHKC